MRVLPVALLPVVVALVAPPAVAACFEVSTPGAMIEGTVSTVKRRHPNGSPLAGYIVTVSAPVCLNDPNALDDVSRVQRLHVVPATTRDATVLKRNLGKRVRATGEPISAHTAYHLADIIMLNSAVTVVAPKAR